MAVTYQYGRDWPKIAKSIKERDGWECRICGVRQGERRLDAHHIDWDHTNNERHNLVTLCWCCHRQVHQEGYKPWNHSDWPVPWGDHPDDE